MGNIKAFYFFLFFVEICYILFTKLDWKKTSPWWDWLLRYVECGSQPASPLKSIEHANSKKHFVINSFCNLIWDKLLLRLQRLWYEGGPIEIQPCWHHCNRLRSKYRVGQVKFCNTAYKRPNIVKSTTVWMFVHQLRQANKMNHHQSFAHHVIFMQHLAYRL